MTSVECKAKGGFFRHIAACHNTLLPGGRVAFRLGATPVGWLAPAFVPRLLAVAGDRVLATQAAITLRDPAGLQALGAELAGAGAYGWRDEAFDVRAEPEGPALARIDRGALPVFGLLATGVHLNGLVRRGGEILLWVARRAANKALDPGKLDHLVAGGVPAGLTARATLAKEAGEEAGLGGALVAEASEVARLRYAMQRPEGLRRDLLICFDLHLPESFQPVPTDGEVESFALTPLAEVAELLRDTDDFKFNVALVLIDLLLRLEVLDPHSGEGRALRAALARGQPE